MAKTNMLMLESAASSTSKYAKRRSELQRAVPRPEDRAEERAAAQVNCIRSRARGRDAGSATVLDTGRSRACIASSVPGSHQLRSGQSR